MRDIAVPYQKQRRQANADLFGFLEEQLAGTEDIRSSGAVDFVLRGLFGLQYKIFLSDRKAQRKGLWIDVVSGSAMTIGLVMAVVGAVFCVFVEVLLNAVDALIWDYSWWNVGAPWLIFFHRSTSCWLVEMKKSSSAPGRKRCITRIATVASSTASSRSRMSVARTWISTVCRGPNSFR